MRTIRITVNGYEVTNVKLSEKQVGQSSMKDKLKRILQKLGIIVKPESTDDPKQRP